MPRPSPQDVRQVLLEEVQRARPKSPTDGSLQQNTVLRRVGERLSVVNDLELEQIVLAEWYGLFRTGYLSWGHNLNNCNPPFFHVTAHGAKALQALSRDPGNPAGYIGHLRSMASLNPVAMSYLVEGLDCYVGGHYKAAAVMLGASSESVILDLRDHLAQRLPEIGQTIPQKLLDWRVKSLLDELQSFIETRKNTLPRETREEFSAYWAAFAQQVRSVRNDAGHPTSVDPVSPDAVHASFLVFAPLAKLATQLHEWIARGLK
jgi:hypothetical protein